MPNQPWTKKIITPQNWTELPQSNNLWEEVTFCDIYSIQGEQVCANNNSIVLVNDDTCTNAHRWTEVG
jgi:hypothetical protein